MPRNVGGKPPNLEYGGTVTNVKR